MHKLPFISLSLWVYILYYPFAFFFNLTYCQCRISLKKSVKKHLNQVSSTFVNFLHKIFQDLHKFRITPKKQKNNSKSTTLAVPPVPGASCSRASRFTMVGYIVFSLREVQRTQFTLNKASF